jgi:hypothetical protein
MAMHKCPHHGCEVSVRNEMFACRPHWVQLPKSVRDNIYATRDLSILDPARRSVIESAAEAWRGDAIGS